MSLEGLQRNLILAFGLGSIQGLIGCRYQIQYVLGIPGKNRHADGDGWVHGDAVFAHVGFVDGLADALGDQDCCLLADTGQHGREFVSAESAGATRGADLFADDFAHALDAVSPEEVAMQIVDGRSGRPCPS